MSRPDAAASDPELILAFWFGDLNASGLADAEHSRRWFTKDPAFDAELRDRFGALHAAVVAGERAGWQESARGCLAAVIVLDQLSRNMFRDTPRMFATDEAALAVARDGLARGFDRALRTHERMFLFMPFMHSEALADQERCVALFQALLAEADDGARATVEYSLGYAVQHRDIVARFGRFPHRNRVLARDTTPEEAEFLTQPGSSF
ncbi:MAG: hypothetical protein AMXMBFR64_18550 [Myxococcales bacterium]